MRLLAQRLGRLENGFFTASLKLMSFALVLTDERHMQKEHCCPEMTEQANLAHSHAKSALLGSTDKRIYRSPVFDEYGLIRQPSAEILVIAHCPFCGARLPASLRERWLEKFDRTGWQTWGDPIPREFLTEVWRES